MRLTLLKLPFNVIPGASSQGQGGCWPKPPNLCRADLCLPLAETPSPTSLLFPPPPERLLVSSVPALAGAQFSASCHALPQGPRGFRWRQAGVAELSTGVLTHWPCPPPASPNLKGPFPTSGLWLGHRAWLRRLSPGMLPQTASCTNPSWVAPAGNAFSSGTPGPVSVGQGATGLPLVFNTYP